MKVYAIQYMPYRGSARVVTVEAPNIGTAIMNFQNTHNVSHIISVKLVWENGSKVVPS
jgi:nitrate reductase NapAB chaperone NapD